MVKKAEETVPHTGINTHVATARGYAKDSIIEPGQFVPDDVPIADAEDGWMREAETA